jgi:hypothetical protein
MNTLTPLDFSVIFAAMICLVGAVFFVCGRLWGPFAARTATPPPPPRPALALAPPPQVLPAPSAPVAFGGPGGSYSELAAWRMEQDMTHDPDTSTTKLTAAIVGGMELRDQIDDRAAGILNQMRHALAGDLAA